MARWSLYGVRIDAQDKLTRRKYVSSPTIMGCNMVIEIAEMLSSDWGVDELRAKSRSLQLFEPDWTQRIWTFGGNLRDVLEWGKMADDSLLIQSYIGCDWAYILNLDAAGSRCIATSKGSHTNAAGTLTYHPTAEGNFIRSAHQEANGTEPLVIPAVVPEIISQDF